MRPLKPPHRFAPRVALLALMAAGVAVPTLAAYAGDSTMSAGETKARASNCFSCHAVDHKLVGPAYQAVADRYAGQGDDTVAMLVKKIKMGGAGNWGEVPMTAHPELSDADITEMVQWILSLHGAAANAPAAAATTAQADDKAAAPVAGEMHTYKTPDGKAVQVDFAVFTGPDQKEVSKSVFHGYEQYNSYCFRCHGGDAIGGEYAPDLRKSLANGMTYEQFLSTAMVGRQAKGMPSWAGFFEPQDIRAIYEYVKARQLELVPPGRPPSAQD
ncbi:MAG TPA: c-type cytochrome [Dyella sp.]|nr:c-type cytochrome [Dyella sp.]